MPRKRKFQNTSDNTVRPRWFPTAQDWSRIGDNVNWLGGQGAQLIPAIGFQNTLPSGSQDDHGKVFSVYRGEFPGFVNPNILSYRVEVSIRSAGTLIPTGVLLTVGGNATTAVSMSIPCVQADAGNAIGYFYSQGGLTVHRNTQFNSGTFSPFLLPVTMSSIPVSRSFCIDSISFYEINRNTLDADSSSLDFPAVSTVELQEGNYIWAQEPPGTLKPRKSVYGLAYNVSGAVQLGVRQAGLFAWMTPVEVTGALNVSPLPKWQWRASGSTDVPFSTHATVFSNPIFPTNVYTTQVPQSGSATTASLDYAIYLYSVGGNASTTASLAITCSLGNNLLTFPVGTARQWFSGSFSGVRTDGNGGAYLNLGFSTSDLVEMNLKRTAGTGTVYVGAILLGQGNRGQ